MSCRSFGVVVVLALAACQKPNLDATEGGYGGRTTVPASATTADTALTPAPASPAAADTATP